MRIGVVFASLFGAVWFCGSVQAQILDDELPAYAPVQEESADGLPLDDTDNSEALFDEMFQEHSEEERHPDRVGAFGNAVNRVAKAAEEAGALSVDPALNNNKILPLSGEMLIGISKGSFKVFQDPFGRTRCSFAVTLKSSLDREINTMGVRLIYPHRAFAFIFKDVAANGAKEQSITTGGDICYNLTGVPDIEVNLCRIRRTMDNECVKRLKWSDDIEMPKEE